MVRIDEIESGVFRLSIFSTESGFQYNVFFSAGRGASFVPYRP